MAKGVGAKHTACRRGEEVMVKLRNGEVLIDTFIERKGHSVIFLKNYGRLHPKDIKSFAVVKKR